MKSNYKVFVLLAVLLAFVLLASSVVAAETSHDKKEVDDEAKESVNQQGIPVRGKSCRWQGGCCHWGRYGCAQCCHSAAEKADDQVNGHGGGWGGGGGGGGHGGGHCKHGCCGRWKGGCTYCCADAEEAKAYDMASQGLTNN